MENIRNTFESNCKIINLKFEYPGYIGEAKYGIVTALSDEEIKRRYADELAEYSPYIFLSPSFGEIRAEFVRNEKKHQMRQQRSESIFGFDDETSEIHTEVATPSVEDDYVQRESHETLKNAMKELTDVQRRRVDLYYLQGYTIRDIAKMEGVGFSKVEKSLSQALQKLRKIFEQ